MMEKERIERREFLAHSGRTAAGLVAAGFTATSSGYWANETIRLGAIGCGGRFKYLCRSLKKITGVQLVAVADVYDEHLAKARELADPNAFSNKDFRAVLDRPDVDAILIAAPDHWHVPMTIAACAANKDVYVEKPLTHALAEGSAVLEAEKRSGRIIQVGMQQRSMPQFQEALDIFRSGELGKVHKVHMSWNRNQPRGTAPVEVDASGLDWKAFLGSAPEQSFDPYRFRHWRWFWDFGGGILTDLMTHFMDVANWFLELDHPQIATTIGANYQTKGLWQTPDTIQTLLDYPDRELQIHFEGTFINAKGAASMTFMGTEASLYLDRGRYEFQPEPGKGEYREKVLGLGGKGSDFYLNPDGELLHLTNWLECVRDRRPPRCPAEAGVRAVKAAHLGNFALRAATVANWSDLESRPA